MSKSSSGPGGGFVGFIVVEASPVIQGVELVGTVVVAGVVGVDGVDFTQVKFVLGSKNP